MYKSFPHTKKGSYQPVYEQTLPRLASQLIVIKKQPNLWIALFPLSLNQH